MKTIDNDNLSPIAQKAMGETVSYQWIYSDLGGGPHINDISKKSTWQPPMDVFETADEFRIIVELAGMKRSDINLAVRRDRVHIFGVRRDWSPGVKRNYYNMEIKYGPFERIVMLSDSANIEEISANFNEGFLEVIVPKKEKSEKRTIEIKTE